MIVTQADPIGARAPREGEVLAGKYRVERILGAGGMGVVVAAHHLVLDEKVALKLLLPGSANDPQLVARFLREARAAAKIKSEHVARVTDVGQLDDGAPFMVMEYLEGSDLAAYLEREGPLPVELATDFVLQACEALAEAHCAGIVHRDLKPANLFCVQRVGDPMTIKVLDFGISKLTADTVSHSLTQTSSMMGSPLYMSPEQMQSAKTVDARADIWSLGVILFELLVGQPPFDAPLVTELVFKIATEPAPLLRTFRPDAPEALERALTRCLQKDRETRFQTVSGLAAALREFGTSRAAQSLEKIRGTMRRAGVPETDGADVRAIKGAPPGTASTLLGLNGAVVGTTAVAVALPERAHSERVTDVRRTSRGVRVAIVVSLLLVASVALRGLFTTRQTSADLPPVVAQTAETTRAAAAPAPVGEPSLPPAESLAPPSAATPMPPATSPASGATPMPPTTPSVQPAPRVSPRGPPKPTRPIAAPATNCDPPTWQDERGHVHIKKGCQ